MESSLVVWTADSDVWPLGSPCSASVGNHKPPAEGPREPLKMVIRKPGAALVRMQMAVQDRAVVPWTPSAQAVRRC